jgi:hypothetical protein
MTPTLVSALLFIAAQGIRRDLAQSPYDGEVEKKSMTSQNSLSISFTLALDFVYFLFPELYH